MYREMSQICTVAFRCRRYVSRDVADMYRRFEMSQICIERCRRYVSAAAKTFLPAAEKMQLMAQEADVDFN